MGRLKNRDKTYHGQHEPKYKYSLYFSDFSEVQKDIEELLFSWFTLIRFLNNTSAAFKAFYHIFNVVVQFWIRKPAAVV